MVDVRDVAIAHVEAMRRPAADRKRFIIDGDGDNAPTNAHIRQAKSLFPQHAFALSKMRDPPDRAQHSLGYLKRQWDNSLSKQLLGMAYRPQEECIRDTVASMVGPGWVPARPAEKSRL